MAFTIPEDELHIRATRGGGPGGQHVNTSSTRVEVSWEIPASPSLDEMQRARLLEVLASRLDTRGRIRVTASNRRSQLQNREAAIERLHEIVNEALEPPKERKGTRPPAGAKEARLRQKKERTEKKERRKPVDEDE